MMIVARYLHILGFTVWIGGMFFAYMALRPIAAAQLEAPLRLTLWAGVFGKFFTWVGVAVVLILGSGIAMMAQMDKPAFYVMAMATLGIVMMLIFAHLFFAPYRRLSRGVAAKDWPMAGAALAQMRVLLGTNLVLGLVTLTIAGLGPLSQ
jgi:uncharacterized membrane protein